MANHQRRPTIRILLIEDNEDDVEIVRRILGRSVVAIRLAVACDGREAQQLLFDAEREGRGEAWLPDLVVLDLGLPKIDGLHILRRMKAESQTRAVPIVVLTGSSDESQLHACMDLGTNLYLFKPLDIADVMNIVTGVQKYWMRAEELSLKAA